MVPALPLMLASSVVLAQTLPPGVGEWVERGVLGLVVVALIMGWLTPGRQTEREATRADRLEAENQRLRELNEDRTIPLLVRVVDVLDRSQRLDRRGPDGP